MHPDFVSTYLAKCCKLNELLGPFTSKPFPFSSCSGVGCVPKKSGRLRLIHHLSSPKGDSVNDGISREDYSVQYVSIDRAIDAIMRYGTSGQLFKLDVRSAFRIIPVRSEDWSLLGISRQGQYYFDTVLPFDLSSSPAIFNSVAECIECIIINEFSIPDVVHNLNDFLCISATAHLANQHAGILLRAFNYLGIPLTAEKSRGSSPRLVFSRYRTALPAARGPPTKAETPGATVSSYQVFYLPNHYSERSRILSGEAVVRSAGDHPRSDIHEETVGHVQALPKAPLQDPPVRRCAIGRQMVAPPTKQLEWQILLSFIPLDTSARHSAVHGCQWDHRLGRVLRQTVAAGQAVPTSRNSRHCMEGVVRHCRCMRLLRGRMAKDTHSCFL